MPFEDSVIYPYSSEHLYFKQFPAYGEEAGGPSLFSGLRHFLEAGEWASGKTVFFFYLMTMMHVLK